MLNKLLLMGRLTGDPELKTTTSGTSVTSFTLAVERNYGQGGERKTDFVNCVAWRNTAEFISTYFQKGKLMAIDAELQSRNYTDKNGFKRTAWEAVVSQAFFCGDKVVEYKAQTPTLPESSSPAESNPFVNFSVIDDDNDEGLPF